MEVVMQKIFWFGLLVAFLAGCAGPKYTGSGIGNLGGVEIVIINDKETRSGFQKAMEDWLNSHHYKYVVVPDGSKPDLDKLSLEYVGLWSFDWIWVPVIFLADARITAYHKGQRVGEVEYKASNNFNPSKLGGGEERIRNMMDVLFGKRTIDEANKTSNITEDENSQDDDY